MVNLQSIHSLITGKRSIYETIAARAHNVDQEEAAKIFESELEAYMTRLNKYTSDPLNSAATLTDAQAQNMFLEVLESGLTFSAVLNHVYVTRLKGTGTAIGYQPTADGLVYLAQKAGAVDHLSEPVLVQKGEAFSIKNTSDGHQVADHTILFDNRPDFNFGVFLAGYVYVVYPNGDREISWISANRMAQLKQKSSKPAMYDDESFLQTKVIKHALRKVRKKVFAIEKFVDDEQDETWQQSAKDTRTNEQAAQDLARSMAQAQQAQQVASAPSWGSPPPVQQPYQQQQPQYQQPYQPAPQPQYGTTF